MAWGNYVQSELDKIKGKNEKQVQGQKIRLLKALLDDNPDARFATPVATT